ncbi:MAG TPA: hypothetical protein VGK89_02115 [Candidatus Eisenbacteria bacterium]
MGSRPLTDPERAWIAHLRAVHQKRVALGFAIIPASFAIALALREWGPHRPDEVSTLAVGVLAFATILLGVPLSILLVRDQFAAERNLGRDLTGGSAWLFEPPADMAPAIADAETPARVGIAFALLPRSQRIVDPADRSPRARREDVIEVEPHSGSGLYAPLSLEVTRATPGLRFHQRPLSAPERLELERIGRRLAAPRVSTAIAAVALVWLVSLAAANHAPAEGDPPPGVAEAALTVLGGLICARRLVRDARSLVLARRIRQDLDVGLIVRADRESEGGSEFLPISRLLWRLGSAPAGWRDRGHGAERLRRDL